MTLLQERRRPAARAPQARLDRRDRRGRRHVHHRGRLVRDQAVLVDHAARGRSRRGRVGRQVTGDDGSRRRPRGDARARSDVAIVVATSYSTEGVDRTCLTLECPPAFGDQDAPDRSGGRGKPADGRRDRERRTGADAVAQAGRSGVLEAWYPGSEGGSAIARVLFGTVDAQGGCR